MNKNNFGLYCVVVCVVIAGFVALVWQAMHEKQTSTWTVMSESKKEDLNTNLNDNTNDRVKIYISGEVERPGLYDVDPQKRIGEIIRELGGFSASADMNRVNLAMFPKDGQQIKVPKIKFNNYKNGHRSNKTKIEKTKSSKIKHEDDENPKKETDTMRKRAFRYGTQDLN